MDIKWPWENDEPGSGSGGGLSIGNWDFIKWAIIILAVLVGLRMVTDLVKR